MGTMKYKITVHSLGYDDTVFVVEADSKQKASSGFNRRSAIIAWCEHNDIDVDDNFELPLVKVERDGFR